MTIASARAWQARASSRPRSGRRRRPAAAGRPAHPARRWTITSPGDSTRADPLGPRMALQRAGQAGRVVAEHMDHAEMAQRSRRAPRAVAAGSGRPGSRAGRSRSRRQRRRSRGRRRCRCRPPAVGNPSRPVNERREIRVTDENARIEARRRIDGCRPSLAISICRETPGRREPVDIEAPQRLRARRDAECAGRQRRADVRLGPNEPAGQDRHARRPAGAR